MIIHIWPTSATWCRAEDMKPGDDETSYEVHRVPDNFTDDECSALARERHEVQS